MINPRVRKVELLMRDFALRTGLSDASVVPQRYLWTDAFAVCNFLELYKQTDEKKWLDLALKLVTQTHEILGKHRKDSSHNGWISQLSEQVGLSHPTIGGLRIGKKFDECQSNDDFDSTLEWERDGQYFHYLTKWMHALNTVSIITKNPKYLYWAIELAKTAHSAFVYSDSLSSNKRMYWKMSIDLSKPMIESMGQHDPLDGLISYKELQSSLDQVSENAHNFSLQKEIKDFESMCFEATWASNDSLSTGGLLTDIYRIFQLISHKQKFDKGLLKNILYDSIISLNAYFKEDVLNRTPEYRLAFRELGLSIGLHAIKLINKTKLPSSNSFQNSEKITRSLFYLNKFIPIIEKIEKFWLEKKSQSNENWQNHIDINCVMLATSLLPDRYLHLY